MDNLFTIFSVGLWILLGAALVVALSLAIVFNMKVGMRYRQGLTRNLESMRLSKMLVALGIDPQQYLHSESLVEVHEQMQRCRQCSNTSTCDDQLGRNAVNADSIDYCDNEASLQALRQRRQSEASIS